MLLVGAPAGTATDRPPRALALAGWTSRLATRCQEVAKALRGPLDLIVVWEGPGALGAVEVAELVRRGPMEVPVVAVLPPDCLSAGIDLVERGVADYVASDRLERLGVIGRRVLSERWLQFLPDLTRITCHELNNLLAPIPLAASLLRQVLQGEDRQTVEDLESAAVQATRAVDALYWSALHDADPAADGCGSVEVRQLVEIAARRLREAWPSLVVETSHPLSRSCVDPGSARTLLQVVLCLAMEGVEQLAEDQPLHVGAETDSGGRALVSVVWRPRLGAPAPTLAPEVEAAVEHMGFELEVETGTDQEHRLRLVLPRAPSEGRR